MSLTLAREDGPPVLEAPLQIVAYEDAYRLREDGCWRISQRETQKSLVPNCSPARLVHATRADQLPTGGVVSSSASAGAVCLGSASPEPVRAFSVWRTAAFSPAEANLDYLEKIGTSCQ